MPPMLYKQSPNILEFILWFYKKKIVIYLNILVITLITFSKLFLQYFSSNYTYINVCIGYLSNFDTSYILSFKILINLSLIKFKII